MRALLTVEGFWMLSFEGIQKVTIAYTDDNVYYNEISSEWDSFSFYSKI